MRILVEKLSHQSETRPRHAHYEHEWQIAVVSECDLGLFAAHGKVLVHVVNGVVFIIGLVTGTLVVFVGAMPDLVNRVEEPIGDQQAHAPQYRF